MKWPRFLRWLTCHDPQPDGPALDAAMTANVAASHEAAKEEAATTAHLVKQQVQTEQMLTDIRGRSEHARKPSPALVAITDTLRSLERPS